MTKYDQQIQRIPKMTLLTHTGALVHRAYSKLWKMCELESQQDVVAELNAKVQPTVHEEIVQNSSKNGVYKSKNGVYERKIQMHVSVLV